MKTKIQKLKSSKLFYNKWPYKVECTIFGAYIVGRFNLSSVKEWCKGTGTLGLGNSYGSRHVNKGELLTFIDAVEKFMSNDKVQIRTEGSRFNIFCKDKDVLEDIDLQLYRWIRKISGPTTDDELDFLMSNGHKKILCDSLPKHGYKYRVYLKTNFSREKREPFYSWTENYKNKIIISGTTVRWLVGSKFYTQNPFMYVKDDKMLSMLGIYLSGHIKKVEEFIERNTVLAA